jgi:hypothetical protein
VDERRSLDTAWDLHIGDSEPIVRHYLATQRCVHLHGYGFCGRTFNDASSLAKLPLVAATISTGK